MATNVLSLHEIDGSMLMLAGGKGANLGELCRIDGIKVPDGFCVTSEAYKKITRWSKKLEKLLHELSALSIEDKGDIHRLAEKIRSVIIETPVPADIEEDIFRHLDNFSEQDFFAIRSSATAEDLSGASFAGQQDSYLNITGRNSILQHIRWCWASLFTERAVLYRMQNGFAHHDIFLSVIVQQMVFPFASGILFTADPVNGDRKVSSIDAGFGLGEALVSGLVNAEVYKVRDGKITAKNISNKKVGIYPVNTGGTRQQELEQSMQDKPVLTDEQVLELERTGRMIEKHFGSPQDIEWCVANDNFFIVQSRPITTLFPLPGVADHDRHLYISVGHQQMMTDAMKPLGLSFFRLTAPRLMYEAGGRLFVDIAKELASPASREVYVNVLGKSDPLLKSALEAILERKEFIKPVVETVDKSPTGESNKDHSPPDYKVQIDYEPGLVDELIRSSEISIEQLIRDIEDKHGTELLDFILANIAENRSLPNSKSFAVIMTGMNASAWINEKMFEWLGEKNVADVISQSVPHNITSAMGLALMDVADLIRPYPDLIACLQNIKDDNFLDHLHEYEGGMQARDAILAYLDIYGMRCAGEIDITRPRWSERPSTLVPVILNNIKSFGTNGSSLRFEQGLREATDKERNVLKRLKELPGGEQKSAETKKMIDLVRNYSGYREYPKYSIVRRYFIYKQALMKEAARLVAAGILPEEEDIFYLGFEELREVFINDSVDHERISKRKQDFKIFEKLKPPRIMTSDGEIITGTYNRKDLPAGSLAGLAVSSGVIEGRARVITKMENANMQEGDILVTTFTDPGWTPLFVSIKGLVTEVGGLMTHGAVIAREYGLPAVVGVENATALIRDGQQIRVNGTNGYVELL